jgi:hypothetical protein
VGLLWTSDRPVVKAYTGTGQHKRGKREQIPMPWAGFEPTISVSKRSMPSPQTSRPLGPAVSATRPYSEPDESTRYPRTLPLDRIHLNIKLLCTPGSPFRFSTQYVCFFITPRPLHGFVHNLVSEAGSESLLWMSFWMTNPSQFFISLNILGIGKRFI